MLELILKDKENIQIKKLINYLSPIHPQK